MDGNDRYDACIDAAAAGGHHEGTRRKGHCDGEEPGSRPDGVRVGCIHFVDDNLFRYDSARIPSFGGNMGKKVKGDGGRGQIMPKRARRR